MQVVIHMYQIVLYYIIINQVIHIIIHQYFRQLLCGLKIQLLVIKLFTNSELHRNKHQIVVHLFMQQMGQLIQLLLIILVEEHLHLHLMLHIGKDI